MLPVTSLDVLSSLEVLLSLDETPSLVLSTVVEPTGSVVDSAIVESSVAATLDESVAASVVDASVVDASVVDSSVVDSSVVDSDEASELDDISVVSMLKTNSKGCFQKKIILIRIYMLKCE